MLQSILMALLGGALIGLAASALLFVEGRISGISGILAGLLGPKRSESWRTSFLAGLLAGGVLLAATMPGVFQLPDGRTVPMVALAGLLVGFGTRIGGGCTSGHGVCGMSRRSGRSLVATVTFMVTGFVTASLIGWLAGGAS